MENGNPREKIEKAVNWHWLLLEFKAQHLFCSYRLFYFSHVSFVMMILTFTYCERNSLTFFTIMENFVPASELKWVRSWKELFQPIQCDTWLLNKLNLQLVHLWRTLEILSIVKLADSRTWSRTNSVQSCDPNSN